MPRPVTSTVRRMRQRHIPGALWAELTEHELRTVIRSAAARERNSKNGAQKWLHRSTRQNAVSLYIRRFGKHALLEPFSQRHLPAIRRMWLPGGYAHFKVRA